MVVDLNTEFQREKEKGEDLSLFALLELLVLCLYAVVVLLDVLEYRKENEF